MDLIQNLKGIFFICTAGRLVTPAFTPWNRVMCSQVFLLPSSVSLQTGALCEVKGRKGAGKEGGRE